MNRKYLQKFQIKDVVFLAIMSAVALATCAVMPLVISLQPLIFGISQLVTALQIGVFFAIGLYKVRKPGSLLIMALMVGLIQLMMSPPMFLSSVLNGVLIELIVLLYWFVDTKHKPRWWANIGIALLFIVPIFTQIMVYVGAFDIVMDFRKIRPASRFRKQR